MGSATTTSLHWADIIMSGVRGCPGHENKCPEFRTFAVGINSLGIYYNIGLMGALIKMPGK